MATLYELKGQYLELYNWADDPDIDEQAWFDTMEAIDEEIDVKADGYAKLYKEFTAQAEKFKKEAERLTARQKAFENKANGLKQRLFMAMQETGKTEIPNELFKIKIVKNGGLAPLVFDESKPVPEEYTKTVTTTSNDNDKIREALKTGTLDFVKLGERSSRLDIK